MMDPITKKVLSSLSMPVPVDLEDSGTDYDLCIVYVLTTMEPVHSKTGV